MITAHLLIGFAFMNGTMPAQSGGSFAIQRSTISGGSNVMTGGTFRVAGTAGQTDADDISGGTFVLSGGFWQAPSLTCADAAECADQNGDQVRDDNCLWADCQMQSCSYSSILFADIGGAFGNCAPDGFINLFDRNHALACFSGTTACDDINLDAGGAFGSCAPDGFCNLFDANHVLTSFAGTNPCSCPAVPASQPSMIMADSTALLVKADQNVLPPGELIEVRVLLSSGLASLQAYQLHLAVSGGRSGSLELVDIQVQSRELDLLKTGENGFAAVSVARGQMLAGLDTAGVAMREGALLATYIYQASADACGEFLVDVVHNESAGDQTFLVSAFTHKIEISSTEPAVLAVAPGPSR